MRTCIYQEGEIITIETGDCADPFYPGNPLVDWSDSVDVTTPDPTKAFWQGVMLLGLLALPLFTLGGKR